MLDVSESQKVDEFLREFLGHKNFNTGQGRMGKVAKINANEISLGESDRLVGSGRTLKQSR